jgi:hypothetical protein
VDRAAAHKREPAFTKHCFVNEREPSSAATHVASARQSCDDGVS